MTMNRKNKSNEDSFQLTKRPKMLRKNNTEMETEEASLKDLSLLSNSHNVEIFKELYHKYEKEGPHIVNFWKNLLICFEIPRPSTDFDGTNEPTRLDAIRNMVKLMAEAKGWLYFDDDAGNVLLRSSDKTDAVPVVCMQAHLDVVCSKNEGVEHNFELDPVEVKISHEKIEGRGDLWIQATKEITLGADNGVGIAAGLAILEHFTTIPTSRSEIPGMELLLTSNEETDFSGAENFKPEMIKSNRLLNLDSEEDESICIGSAGGFEHSFELSCSSVEEINIHNSEIEHAIYIDLNGFSGGHSGVDIHKNRGNAIKCMARILLATLPNNPQLMYLKGGTNPNSIPRECKVILKFSTEANQQNGITLVKQTFETIQREMELSETEISITVTRVLPATLQDELRLLTLDETSRTINLMVLIPNGVINNCPRTGAVESSCCCTLARLKKGHIFLHLMARSTVYTWMEYFSQELCALGSMAGAMNKTWLRYFPAWAPTTESDNEIFSKLQEAHKSLFDRPAKVHAVHAGLECGTLLEKKPSMVVASVGPTILNAHSPEEKLDVSSACKFMHWLKETVQLLACS